MSLLKNSYFTRASQKENCWPSTADRLSSLLKSNFITSITQPFKVNEFRKCWRYHFKKSHCSKSSFYVQKVQLWFPEKIVDLLGGKNLWKRCGFRLFSCWQLWFHEKNCQKKIGWKTCENVGVLSKLNFWTKIWLFE